MIKIGGLWKRQGKKGEFLAGKMGEASLMVFPNSQKNTPNQPDYIVFVAEDNRNKQQAQGPAPQQQRPQAKPQQQYQNKRMPPAPPIDDNFSEYAKTSNVPDDDEFPF